MKRQDSKRATSRTRPIRGGVAFAFIGAFALLVAACSGGGGDTTSRDEQLEELLQPTLSNGSISDPEPSIGAVVGRPVPELAGISGWVNSEPLTLESLRGKVVLIDFWTYTCINCIRTMPFLRSWQEKYANEGLVILGIHAPEFEFEKSLANVQQAVMDNGLEYPVALDNDMVTWTAFRNQYWPRKYLVDKDGIVRYDHIGEGGYEETETWIQRLLTEAGASVQAVELVQDPERVPSSFYSSLTPEIYAGTRGFFQGQIGNIEQYQIFLNIEYTWPSSPRKNALYLRGLWRAETEYIRHARVTTDFEDALLLDYTAGSVNLVIRPEDPEPFDLLLLLDGEPLGRELRGDDVRVGEDGQTYVRVDSPRLYSLVRSDEFAGHRLTIAANSDAFAFYAFTFGVRAE